MSHCHSINEGPVLQPWLSSSTSASEDAVINLYKRTSLSARAARSVSGDTQNRRHSPVAWLPVAGNQTHPISSCMVKRCSLNASNATNMDS